MRHRHDRVRPGTVGSYSTIGTDKQDTTLSFVEKIEMACLMLAFALMYIVFEVAF